jgi:predicted nucleotidyltransferase component of viral defense system
MLDNTTYMLYILSVRRKILAYQQAVLKKLAGKIDDFYLAGGTALSLFYFQHRLSVDLDFFTKDFEYTRITEIVEYLKKTLKKEIKLVGQTFRKERAKIMVYTIHFSSKDTLKIDFVEDGLGLVKPTKVVEGVKILSLEDIYLRKLYALVGVAPSVDEIGRRGVTGGRVEAKDLFDLYFLSHTFMPLSKFVDKYCDLSMIEGLINWFRSYDRLSMIDRFLELNTDKRIDYKRVENHFKKEIDKIVEKRIEGI